MHKYEDFVRGLQLFNLNKSLRDDREKKILFTLGSAQILIYKVLQSDKPIILIIPSLINKYYILDLEENSSFLESLSQQNYNILIIKWQDPIEEEYNFGLEEYLFLRIKIIIEEVCRIFRQKIILCGYCLGGTMSLIMSRILPNNLKYLILIATPWDFSKLPYLNKSNMIFCKNLILPLELKYFFWNLDLENIINKFERFSRFANNSEEYKKFLLVENWLDDGIIVTAKLVSDIFSLAQNDMKVFKELNKYYGLENLQEFSMKKFLVITKLDKIVNYSSSNIMRKMPNTTANFADTGHIALFIKKDIREKILFNLNKWQKNSQIST